jgi:hypothetical protein
MLAREGVTVETLHSGGETCNASFGTIAIYDRWLEMGGSPAPGVPKCERAAFCACKFFVSD